METIIRAATKNDLAGILEITNHAILHTTANYSYDPQTLEEIEEWFGQKQASGYPVFVAEWNSKIVGFSTYGKFRERTGYKFTVEHSVYVADGFSGKGIGAKLLETLILKAKEQGYRVMVGGIDASNEGSIAFHRKFGFEECGVVRQAAFKFGRWLDLLFMQKILD